MKSADLLIKSLEAQGVEYIFGLPGEENLTLLEAIRKSSIKFIVTRDEQGAVFMASTMGRLTGRVGVALSTLGPGATNLLTGVAFAQLGGMPLLVITGQKPIKKSKQGMFQIINVVRMMEPITKMSKTIISGDRIPVIIHDAVKLAESERPGAVHIELPEDIAEEETNSKVVEWKKIRRPGPDPKAITMALSAIENSSSPLLVVASGANRKLIRKHLNNFIEKTHIPFITTQMGKGVIDESSSYYLGTTALSEGDYVHKMIEHSDLVILLGHDIMEKPPFIMDSSKKIIHINFYPALTDEVYLPEFEIVGDISHTLWALNEEIKIKDWDFSYFYKLKDLLNKDIKKRETNDSFPMKPEVVVSKLREAIPKDGILALDNGMYKLWIARNYRAYEQNTVLLDNNLATMGAGLPAGIAAKLLNPEKKVVVISGDGGFLMNVSELETAVRLKLDLVIVVLNNSGFGMIKWKQSAMNYDNFGLSFNNPDFVILAESFGASGYKIKDSKEFSEILNKVIDKKGIHVIDVEIDDSENKEFFNKELKEQINSL